jgi:hypothetical protein
MMVRRHNSMLHRRARPPLLGGILGASPLPPPRAGPDPHHPLLRPPLGCRLLLRGSFEVAALPGSSVFELLDRASSCMQAAEFTPCTTPR